MTALYSRADELRRGDRLAPGFLPSHNSALVLLTEPYDLNGRPWVFVAYREDDGSRNGDHWLADAAIPVEIRAEYAREIDNADEPVPVPPGVEGGHVGAGPGRHTETPKEPS